MAVKVDCSICNKFIKSVEPHDFQRLTGEEICTKCGKKVDKVYSELDKLVEESANEIAEARRKLARVTGAFNEIVKKHMNHLSSFHTTRTAELDSKMKGILGGK